MTPMPTFATPFTQITKGSETRLSVLRLAAGALFLGVPRLLVLELMVKVRVAILVRRAKVEVRQNLPAPPVSASESAAAGPILRLLHGRRWRELVDTARAGHVSLDGAPIQATDRMLLLVHDAQAVPHVRRPRALLGGACAAVLLLAVWAGTIHLLPSTQGELAERQPTTTVAALSVLPGRASRSNATSPERTAPPIAVSKLADDGSGFGFCLFFFLPFC